MIFLPMQQEELQMDACLLECRWNVPSIVGVFFLPLSTLILPDGCCVEECVFIVSIRKKNEEEELLYYCVNVLLTRNMAVMLPLYTQLLDFLGNSDSLSQSCLMLLMHSFVYFCLSIVCRVVNVRKRLASCARSQCKG